MKLKVMCLAACVFAFGACGEEEENELEGLWSGTCTAQGSGSSLTTFDVGEDDLSLNFTIYSDTACATQFQSYTYGYAYVAGDEVAVPAGAKALDLTLATATTAPHTAELVTTMNSNSAYGKTGWTIDTHQDTIGFDDAGTAKDEAAGDVYYTIYQVDGSQLCLGSSSDAAVYDGLAAETRIQVLATGTSCYTK